jgi:hypothetical protein
MFPFARKHYIAMEQHAVPLKTTVAAALTFHHLDGAAISTASAPAFQVRAVEALAG